MPISLTCPCSKKLRVRDELAGKDIRCPGCNRTIRVPPQGVVESPVEGKHVAAASPEAIPEERLAQARKLIMGCGIFWIVFGLLRSIIPAVAVIQLGVEDYMTALTKGFIRPVDPANPGAIYVVLFVLLEVCAVGLIVCGVFATLRYRMAAVAGMVLAVPLVGCGFSYVDSITRGRPDFGMLFIATLLPFAALGAGIVLIREMALLKQHKYRTGSELPPTGRL